MERCALVAKDLVVNEETHLLLIVTNQGFISRDMGRLDGATKTGSLKQLLWWLIHLLVKVDLVDGLVFHLDKHCLLNHFC